MDIYKTKSVYKAPGVYRSGIYKDPSEVVLLNGVRYENRFYEIDSNKVGSTFVDTVRLPEGYEKLGRVWYNGTYGNAYPSLIKTDFDLPLQFGDIYCGFNLVSLSIEGNYRIFFTDPAGSNYKKTSLLNNANNISAARVIVWNNPNSYKTGILSESAQISDENKAKLNLLNGTWENLNYQSGNEQPPHTLYLLSSRGLCYLRFFFVADRNRRVTFTAIPCKHGSDYGLYDVVAGKFYTHADLTGD